MSNGVTVYALFWRLTIPLLPRLSAGWWSRRIRTGSPSEDCQSWRAHRTLSLHSLAGRPHRADDYFAFPERNILDSTLYKDIFLLENLKAPQVLVRYRFCW